MAKFWTPTTRESARFWQRLPSAALAGRIGRRSLLALIAILALAGCASDEEARQWHVDDLTSANILEPAEARCYVDKVADEFGVRALNPTVPLTTVERQRLSEIDASCRIGESPPDSAIAFAEESAEDHKRTNSEQPSEIDADEISASPDTLPPINYNRRKNAMKRLQRKLGLTKWDASCLIDSLLAETERNVSTWAAASAELQNELLATCLGERPAWTP